MTTKKTSEDIETEIKVKAEMLGQPKPGYAKCEMSLEFSPTEGVVLKATGLPKETAMHLIEHIQDGIQSFIECTQAKGFATTYVADNDNNVLQEDTKDFNFRRKAEPIEPIDPKKVN